MYYDIPITCDWITLQSAGCFNGFYSRLLPLLFYFWSTFLFAYFIFCSAKFNFSSFSFLTFCDFLPSLLSVTFLFAISLFLLPASLLTSLLMCSFLHACFKFLLPPSKSYTASYVMLYCSHNDNNDNTDNDDSDNYDDNALWQGTVL